LEPDADRRQVRGLALVVVLVLIVIVVRYALDQVLA
jgi:Tfp pilus assembly protein PilX